jgi:hypothetical protein
VPQKEKSYVEYNEETLNKCHWTGDVSQEVERYSSPTKKKTETTNHKSGSLGV